MPERQRRTQQGILLEDVDFDDFDLNNNDDNPEKGTQTDAFNETESESIRTPEQEIKERIEEDAESENITEPQQEVERERTREKSIMQRLYDGVFGENDALAEEREEMQNRRQQIEDDDLECETPIEPQKSGETDDSLPMNVKKSCEPSSESSSSRRSSDRSVLLPVEEEALSEYINSSAPETVESSNRTIEYVESNSAPKRDKFKTFAGNH